MPRRKFVVGLDCKNLVQQAIEKHLPLTITVNSDDSWKLQKSYFLGVRSQRLILACPTPQADQTQAELVAAQEVAVSFKKGYNKCFFVSRIIGNISFELPSGESVPAITVYHPEQIEKVQRRAYDRAAPPADQDVTVTFWRGNNDKKTAQKWSGWLKNLSAGGLGLTMLKSDLPGLQANEPIELVFTPMPDSEPLHLQARFRHVSNSPDDETMAMLGLQLMGLEMTEEGRATLRQISRVLNLYQRQQQIGNHPNLTRQS